MLGTNKRGQGGGECDGDMLRLWGEVFGGAGLVSVGEREVISYAVQLEAKDALQEKGAGQ